MIVNGGKKFLRDYIAGANAWQTVNTGIRYMGAGSSTDTNGGVTGPSGLTYTDADGSWQGPANSDFKLSTEITVGATWERPQCSFTVGSNGTVHVQAQFTDANFESGTTEDYDLVEFGIFLSSDGAPGNSPVDFPTAVNKQNAMINRTVNFYKDVNEYKAFTYTKTRGVPLIINFDLIDFGA